MPKSTTALSDAPRIPPRHSSVRWRSKVAKKLSLLPTPPAVSSDIPDSPTLPMDMVFRRDSHPVGLTITRGQLAKLIDHALYHPTLTDSEIYAGLELARRFNVAAACVKPYSVATAKAVLAGSGVAVCCVIGSPHGANTTAIKILEAEEAIRNGAQEIDMVVNVGKVLGGNWEYVANEVKSLNQAVVRHGAILKVIFENDYLEDEQIVDLCRLCTLVGVAFVKTSTGFGFVKQPDGGFASKGATAEDLRLMSRSISAGVQIAATGGVRTVDECAFAMSLGATRIGTTGTERIMIEAAERGIRDLPVPILLNTDGKRFGGRS